MITEFYNPLLLFGRPAKATGAIGVISTPAKAIRSIMFDCTKHQ